MVGGMNQNWPEPELAWKGFPMQVFYEFRVGGARVFFSVQRLPPWWVLPRWAWFWVVLEFLVFAQQSGMFASRPAFCELEPLEREPPRTELAAWAPGSRKCNGVLFFSILGRRSWFGSVRFGSSGLPVLQQPTYTRKSNMTQFRHVICYQLRPRNYFKT